MKKNLIFLVLLLFLQNCGYSPILSSYKDRDFNFNIIEIKGDSELNKIIKLKMNKFSSNSKNKTYDLKINTSVKKEILSKNKKGEATSYSIFTYIKFEIINITKPKIFSFEERTKTTKIDDEFELKRYENVIKTNFVTNKINELVTNLTSGQ
jgi:hypothetical protein